MRLPGGTKGRLCMLSGALMKLLWPTIGPFALSRGWQCFTMIGVWLWGLSVALMRPLLPMTRLFAWTRTMPLPGTIAGMLFSSLGGRGRLNRRMRGQDNWGLWGSYNELCYCESARREC